jgi:hypothetical protein
VRPITVFLLNIYKFGNNIVLLWRGQVKRMSKEWEHEQFGKSKERQACLLNSQPIDLKSCNHLYTFIVQKIVRDTRHRVNVLVIYYRKFLLYELFACCVTFLEMFLVFFLF